MYSYNTIFSNNLNLEQFIRVHNIKEISQCLVTIYAPNKNTEECVQLAQYVKQQLPQAKISGCAVCAVVFDGEIYENDILLSFHTFEYGKVFTEMVHTAGMSGMDVVNRIVDGERPFEPTLGLLFFGYLEFDIHQIAKSLDERMPEVAFAGGAVGYFLEDGTIQTFVFDETGYDTQGFLLAYISKGHVLSYQNVVVGHPAISGIHEITKAQDDYVDEIDGVPAIDWINTELGLRDFQENTDWNNTVATDILLRFPLVLEGYHSATRFLQYEAETNRMKLYFNKIEKGETFRVGYLSPLRSAEHWQEVCHDLQSISVESVVCFSCLFRKLFSNSLSKWELNAFRGTNISGAFLLGELGTSKGQVQYLNGACSIITLAEKEHYIKPNLEAFDSIEEIIDDNAELIKQINIVQQTLVKEEENTIFERLIQYENHVKDRMATNNKLGLKSSIEFLQKQSLQEEKFVCFISALDIENQVQQLGETVVKKMVQANFQYILTYLKDNYENYTFDFFSYDITNIYFTIEQKVKEEEFLAIGKELYTYCNAYNLIMNNPISFNTITLSMEGASIEKLAEFSKHELHNLDKKRVYILDRKTTEENDLQDEFEMVATIREIIREDRIIPYFQGIYDNRKNLFFCYEALMRLQDKNGKILFPNDFMDISKKYELYLELSQSMVLKTLSLFENREEIITVNISALDIASKSFQEQLFKKLDSMNHPGHFIFELVESERFEDIELLRKFIYRIRQYGIKIAVDDFGSGYSNFIEIGNLQIDFIKINGSLTQLLGTDNSYDQILESISFMGKQMHVELIAEYVETPSMQKRLLSSGVQYSQGYLFSKPMSMEELNSVSRENKEKLKVYNSGANEEIIEGFSLEKRAQMHPKLYFVGLALMAIAFVFTILKMEGNEQWIGLGIIMVFALYFTGVYCYAQRETNELIRALEESNTLNKSLQASVEIDSLTRTYSRATAFEKITEIIRIKKNIKMNHALIIIDVDNFKEINDTYGHQTGDIYLQDFVSAVKSGLRNGDILGRMGGDEFIVLLNRVEAKRHVEEILTEIFEVIRQIRIRDTNLDNIGVSAGVVMIPEWGEEFQMLNSRADQALYEAKQLGKNQFVFFEKR